MQDDTLWNHLSATGAKSKRPGLQPDAPAQQPMRAGIKPADRRAPSSDQKKVRRLQQQTRTATKESTMSQHTEADLLAKMAAATTLAEQSEWGQRLNDLRNARRDQIAASASLDFDAMGADLRPTYVMEPLTAAMGSRAETLDWDALVPTQHDDRTVATAMQAEAALWYEGLWEPVKHDAAEFAAQTRNAARRTAARFGQQADGAASVFVERVAHLHTKAGFKVADANEVPQIPSVIPNEAAGPNPTDKTFDGLVNGEQGETNDPKSTDIESPSLKEGDTPEGDSAQGIESPIADTDGAKYVNDNAQGTSYTDPMPSGGKGASRKVAHPGVYCPKTDDYENSIDGVCEACGKKHDPDARDPHEASLKTAIHLTNVGIEGQNGVGTAPNGNRITFKVTPAELAQLKSVLYSDMSVNFSGVDIDESDVISWGPIGESRPSDTEPPEPMPFSSSLFASLRAAFAEDDPKSTTNSAPSLAEGDAPEGDHASAAEDKDYPAQDASSQGSTTKDYLDGQTYTASRYDGTTGKPGSTATCKNCKGGLTAASGSGTWLHDKNGTMYCPGKTAPSETDESFMDYVARPENIREADGNGGWKDDQKTSGLSATAACTVYPEGKSDEDGADEPYCEKHTNVGNGVIHEMSNGLLRVTDADGKYIDSADDMADARSLAKDASRGHLAALGARIAREAQTDNTRTFGAALSRMASLDESVAGFTGHDILGMVLASGDVTEETREAVRPFFREATDLRARCSECGHTYDMHGGPKGCDQCISLGRDNAGHRFTEQGSKQSSLQTEAATGTCKWCGAPVTDSHPTLQGRVVRTDSLPKGQSQFPPCSNPKGTGHEMAKQSSIQTEAEQKAKPGEIEHLNGGSHQRSKCQHCGDTIRRKSGIDGMWLHAKTNSRYCS